MQIQIGKIYVNKTLKYLFPTLRAYGPGLRNKISELHKVAVGVHDDFYKAQITPSIFILIDREHYRNKTISTLNWLRYQPYYVTDYPYDDLVNGRLHMIILRLPKRFHHSFEAFTKGKYSEMFTDEEIEEFVKTDVDMFGAYKVLTRKKEAYTEFLEKIEESFGMVEVKATDLIDKELDFPLEKEKEIFNYVAPI